MERDGSFFEITGGKGGIRTPDALADIHDFESCAFDHSATFPRILLGLSC